jgi:hypothetical protein
MTQNTLHLLQNKMLTVEKSCRSRTDAVELLLNKLSYRKHYKDTTTHAHPGLLLSCQAYFPALSNIQPPPLLVFASKTETRVQLLDNCKFQIAASFKLLDKIDKFKIMHIHNNSSHQMGSLLNLEELEKELQLQTSACRAVASDMERIIREHMNGVRQNMEFSAHMPIPEQMDKISSLLLALSQDTKELLSWFRYIAPLKLKPYATSSDSVTVQEYIKRIRIDPRSGYAGEIYNTLATDDPTDESDEQMRKHLKISNNIP